MKNIIAFITIGLFLALCEPCLAQLNYGDAGKHIALAASHSLDRAVKSIELDNDVTLEYTEQGERFGRPVIFLHGITDSRHSFDKVLPELPASVHAFAITLRGHGNSSKPGDNYHPKDFASDVASFIKCNDLGPSILVGHSMGGVIAQQFALDYPELTTALVIIDSDASFSDNPGMNEFVNKVLRLTDPVSYKFADDFQKATLASPIDSSYYKLVVSESLKVPAFVWKAAFTGLIQVDYTSQLKTLGMPVLIFWGEKDSFCFIDDQQVFVDEIKNLLMIRYEDTGHALHWEEPRRFAADLVAFISNLR